MMGYLFVGCFSCVLVFACILVKCNYGRLFKNDGLADFLFVLFSGVLTVFPLVAFIFLALSSPSASVWAYFVLAIVMVSGYGAGFIAWIIFRNFYFIRCAINDRFIKYYEIDHNSRMFTLLLLSNENLSEASYLLLGKRMLTYDGFRAENWTAVAKSENILKERCEALANNKGDTDEARVQLLERAEKCSALQQGRIMRESFMASELTPEWVKTLHALNM